jgi:hypothetical protein
MNRPKRLGRPRERFRAEKVIDRHAKSRIERSIAPRQQKARQADSPAIACHRCESMGSSGSAHVPSGSPARNDGYAQLCIHRDLPHAGEVDHQAAISQRAAGPVVPATAHRQGKAVRAGNPHSRPHVFAGFAQRKQRRPMVNGAIPDPPNAGVSVLAGCHNLPLYCRSEIARRISGLGVDPCGHHCLLLYSQICRLEPVE